MSTQMEWAAPARDSLWNGVDRVLDTMDGPAALAHYVAPIAARRWRLTGRVVPEEVAHQERAAHFGALLAIPVLARARDAYAGRMLLMKGPEVEARYPEGGRAFGDLDLLVDDVAAAYAALQSAGFDVMPEARDRSPIHLRALRWHGSAFPIEVHLHPNWPRHLDPPPNQELFEAAVPSRVPVDGLEAPSAEHHTLLLAAHSWKHMPLGYVRDLLDVSLFAAESDAQQLTGTARRWGLERILETTLAAARWLFEDDARPLATRLWARHLSPAREPSILERHARRWVASFWMLPPGQAAIAALKNIGADARPVDDEGWATKLQRIIWVAAHPRRTRSERPLPEHDEDF